jgi:23S rRNA pseudouridine1911/1915/1917 synthase
VDNSPYILEETENYAVVFKPPKMHSREQGTEVGNQDTLSEWYKKQTQSMFDIMHRLDYETHGLVLFAKNEKSFYFFKDLQDKGEFIKEYSAVCVPTGNENISDGFPECSLYLCGTKFSESPFTIESYFRPYGPGRKQVRPVIEDGKKHKEIAKDKGGFYRTEIINVNDNVFTVQIKRGFRHQIRCHLCWIGFPILNDPLYSQVDGEQRFSNGLALRAHALYFIDPANGEKKECRLPVLNSLQQLII